MSLPTKEELKQHLREMYEAESPASGYKPLVEWMSDDLFDWVEGREQLRGIINREVTAGRWESKTGRWDYGERVQQTTLYRPVFDEVKPKGKKGR